MKEPTYIFLSLHVLSYFINDFNTYLFLFLSALPIELLQNARPPYLTGRAKK